jgi:hypothetical protein
MGAVDTHPVVSTAKPDDISQVVFLTAVYPKMKHCNKSTKALLITGCSI